MDRWKTLSAKRGHLQLTQIDSQAYTISNWSAPDPTTRCGRQQLSSRGPSTRIWQQSRPVFARFLHEVCSNSFPHWNCLIASMLFSPARCNRPNYVPYAYIGASIPFSSCDPSILIYWPIGACIVVSSSLLCICAVICAFIGASL